MRTAELLSPVLCVCSGWRGVRRRRVHCERRLHPLRPDGQAGLLRHRHGAAQTGKRNTHHLTLHRSDFNDPTTKLGEVERIDIFPSFLILVTIFPSYLSPHTSLHFLSTPPSTSRRLILCFPPPPDHPEGGQADGVAGRGRPRLPAPQVCLLPEGHRAHVPVPFPRKDHPVSSQCSTSNPLNIFPPSSLFRLNSGSRSYLTLHTHLKMIAPPPWTTQGPSSILQPLFCLHITVMGLFSLWRSARVALSTRIWCLLDDCKVPTQMFDLSSEERGFDPFQGKGRPPPPPPPDYYLWNLRVSLHPDC